MGETIKIRSVSAVGIEVEMVATNPKGIIYHAMLTWEDIKRLELEKHGWTVLCKATGHEYPR